VYNLTRSVKTLWVAVHDGKRFWQQRSPAMTAGLIDYIWSIRELLMTVVAPQPINTQSVDYRVCCHWQTQSGLPYSKSPKYLLVDRDN